MAEPAVDPLDEQAAQIVSGMALEDKVAQMFVITPEALTGYTSVTAAGDTTKTAYESRPVGGLIYMADNLLSTEQTTEMLTNMQTRYNMQTARKDSKLTARLQQIRKLAAIL